MRFNPVRIFALMAIAIVIPTTGHADPYKWCAQYGSAGMGGRNCGFISFQQCQATVSGAGGFCERNAFYTGSRERKRTHAATSE
jgi:hypothetical protein